MRQRPQVRRRAGGEVAAIVSRCHRVHGEDVETAGRRGGAAVGLGAAAAAAHAVSPAVPEGVEGVGPQGTVAVGQTGGETQSEMMVE